MGAIPNRVDDDFRIRSRGNVFENDVDRPQCRRNRFAGQNHHSGRQSAREIECQRMQNDVGERRRPLLRPTHIELIVCFAHDDVLAIEA